ncbi:small membrane protein, partial [Klebsiella pneumoniae]
MSNLLLLVLAVVLLFTSLFFGLSYVREGANKQVISSQADSLIKISRIWADFFPANNRISLF